MTEIETQAAPSTYHEVQRFSQGWMQVLTGVGPALAICIFGYAIVSQVLLGHPFGNRPMPNGALLAFGALVIALSVGVFILMRTATLVVVVLERGLYIHYKPFMHRMIEFTEIERAEAVTYRPIREFGGWGVRYGSHGARAYNVSGNRGVNLTLTNGKRVLVGSQSPERLAAAINGAMGRPPTQPAAL